MSDDKELIARLRMVTGFIRFETGDRIAASACLSEEAADRIEALTKERERLSLAICGGEDAPGYANAQTVETLEKVARDWGVGVIEQINRTLAVEAKLAKAVEALDMLVRDCEADYPPSHVAIKYFAIGVLAEIKGESHECL